MILFNIFWCIAAIVSLVIGWFFISALMHGTVHFRSIKGWLFMLFTSVFILWISIILRKQGYHKSAIAAVLILVVPAIIYGLYILLMTGNTV